MNIIDLEMHNSIPDDIVDIFINDERKKEKEKFLKKFGDKIYTYILFKLVLVEFKPEIAKEIFNKSLENKKRLEELLGRKVLFCVSLFDYLVSKGEKYLEKPLIIERNLFMDLQKYSIIDELTGLKNFRYYNMRIKEEINRADRNKSKLSIILFDIDNFKKYNDIYGHTEGNKILKKIAEIIKKSIRKSDIGIRYGGDEFLIILPDTDKKGAFILANKIKEKIKKCKGRYPITISGGIATYPDDTRKTYLDLFNIADKSLYLSKYKGKDMILSFVSERRKENRIYFIDKERIKIIFKNIHNKKVRAKLLNISKGGMCIKVNKDFDTPSFLEGEILKERIDLKFKGQVIWSQPENKSKKNDNMLVGIKFDELKSESVSIEELEG